MGALERRPTPGCTEEYRYRLRLLGVHWALLRLRRPYRQVLPSARPQVLTDHAEYIIGKTAFKVQTNLFRAMYPMNWKTRAENS